MKTKRTEMTETLPRRELGVFDDMDRAFDRLLHHGWMHPFQELWPEGGRLGATMEMTPRVDVVDRETEILVRAELPGIAKDDLEVELVGDLLTIRGEHKQEETQEEGAYFRAEISRGSFSRTIRLPAEVTLEETLANFQDGVLEIHLPKTQKTERRRIEIK